MFQHRTRSGRAWACKGRDGPAPMASRPLPGLAPQGYRGRGVKGEEEDGGGIHVLVKDLRTRRVFTPSSLPLDYSPDRDAKAGAEGEALSPDLDAVVGDRDGAAGIVAMAELPPGEVDVVEEVPEKVDVLLDRGAEGVADEAFRTGGSSEEEGIESTPPHLHVLSKSEATVGVDNDGSHTTSQRSDGCADEGFLHKQKKWSDQSHSRPGIVPCSRMMLVRNPGSFNYRRLLPFLMDLTRSSSTSLEVLPCQSRAVRNEKPMSEKSIKPLSSSPAQAKKHLSEMHKDLDSIGHTRKIADVLEQPGNDAHELLTENSKDDVQDTAAKSTSAYTENASLSPQFNAYGLEVVCKSSGNAPATTEALSFGEVGRAQGPSDFPGQLKADSGMIVNGCIKLSTQASVLGAAGPVVRKDSPYMKGILKRHGGGCMGICTCLDCSSFRLHAERAFEFSRKQMQEAEDVAMGLINELSCLRMLVEKHYATATCVTLNGIHQHSQVKGLCRRATRVEDLAKKRLREMTDDLNVHCRIIRPRVTFSESTEERAITGFGTSDSE
uniref:Pyrroline-5-carboxylate reductase n=1 Tax=Anthurium amnicola TaxID=1678845 RepID=A0A1D1ZGA1_9ARAE